MTLREMIDEYGESLSIPSYVGWQAEGTLQYCSSKRIVFWIDIVFLFQHHPHIKLMVKIASSNKKVINIFYKQDVCVCDSEGKFFVDTIWGRDILNLEDNKFEIEKVMKVEDEENGDA